MSAYLEFHIKGGGCAVIEAGAICGVVGKGHDIFALGTSDAPTLVIFRGAGETLEVIGESVGGIIGRMYVAKKKAKEVGVELHFERLTPLGEGEQDAADGQPLRD